MDASDYKHVLRRLLLLQYISETSKEKMSRLVAELNGQFAKSERLEQAF